ncbi:protein FAR1-RELATED SEQUENCE 5-like isoform X1 [Salvia splendens]|uniref:protein FAR1-RELATED SEQUENCE 5-like isoform X1 n=3 Tax=Salvia splendens TaxID=180675 RepID=UPI001C27BF95|nr:protein FAR1-RELATED SEQUENCE 5-like isoform X1 [Salvia splendens]
MLWKSFSLVSCVECFRATVKTFAMDVDAALDGGNGLMEASVQGDVTSREAERNAEPYVGMVFETEAAARAYYNEYAGRAGFLTRIISSSKSEGDGSFVSCGFGCRSIPTSQKTGNVSNEGGQKRRGGCTATLLVKQDNGGRWVVKKFVRDHDHPLVVSLPRRCPTFDEKDKRIQELTAEIRVKKRLSAAYREQLLILMKDVESHTDHITSKVQMTRNNLKELEERRQQLSNHKKPSL